MSESYTHETYLSPFTWRYGSEEMRQLWSEHERRRLWRQLWVALAEAEQTVGLVREDQVADLRASQNRIDLERSHQIEAEIRHDLMAEVRCYAEQCPVGGGIIHLGATSMDIEDNADALRLRSARELVRQRLAHLLATLSGLIEREADHVCMAFTHLQPAEPTTIGYRLANYTQDLLADYEALNQLPIRGKGFKGAVGTAASYSELLEGTPLTPGDLEALVMQSVGLEAFPVTHQTYPRHQDWQIVNVLAGIGMTIYRLAFDMRLLQSPPFGEWAEPFGKAQVGSSAMPFKRNPINAENLDSLARHLATLPRVAWDNAAHSLLERTLDDSANRRVYLPEAFLIVDEMLLRLNRILEGIRFNEESIQRNLAIYGVFAATERVLMAAARAGGDRQALHEIIREHSLMAWAVVQQGGANPLVELLVNDAYLLVLLPAERIRELLNADQYVGDAPARARALALKIKRSV
ncbi:MAG TPA: adenylosuccinate lyase [Aggregatilineales bacterium]|nr:adenylosuccinate lyase [Aggregatilineales bacterium]